MDDSKNLRLLLLILLAFTSKQTLAQDLQPEWFTVIKGPHSESRQLIEPDNRGNVFATGVITLYDEIYQTENGYIDTVKIERYNNLVQTTYFAKLGKNGKVLFHKILVQHGNAEPKDIEMDSYGNIYLLYSFMGTLNFDNNLVSSFNSSNTNLILVKYDSEGEYKWSKTYLGEAEIYGEKIDINSKNEITVLCTIVASSGNYSVNIGDSPFVFEGNFLMVRFDGMGTVQWMRNLISFPQSATKVMRYHRVTDLLTDEDGSTYISGFYEGAIYFSENDYLYSDTSWPVFLVKYTPSNTVEWVRGFENPNGSALVPLSLFRRGESVGIAVLNHSAGSPFTTHGFTLSSYTIGLEYSEDGALQKAYDFYTGNSVIIDVAYDKGGNVYLFGGLAANEIFQYEDITVNSPVSKWLLIKYSQEKIEWAQFHGDGGFGTDLEVDNMGDIYWSGAWACTTKIFDKTFVAEGCGFQRSDALISKLSSKAFFLQTDQLCSDSPISFKFDYYDFYTSSTITDFKVVIDNQEYDEPNFSHTFETGGIKELKVLMTDNLDRSYFRGFKVDIFEINPEIQYENGTLYSKTYNNITTYTWLRDNEVVATTSNPQLKINVPGLYYLRVQAQNECIFISNEIEVKIEDIITSVEDEETPKVLFWPNPATNTLYVSSVNTPVEISILALDGRTILTKNIVGQSQIDISEFPQGLFVVKTKNKSGSAYARIYIQ